MSTITTDIPVNLLGTQVVIPTLSTTPIQIFETPLPNGYLFMTFFNGTTTMHLGSANILVTPLATPITYNTDSKIFFDNTVYPVNWNFMYGSDQVTLFWDPSTQTFNMVSPANPVTNLVIRRFLIPGPAYTGSTLYGIDRMQASNPTPGSAVSVQSPLSVTYTGQNALNFKQATVTQITNLTTAVSLNGASGIITTVSATTPSLSTETFTVNNTSVSATSVVLVSLSNYSGSTLPPQVTSSQTVAGSFQIQVSNLGASALDGALTISFMVC